MLDLKELERKLDNALAKETKESLTRWLKAKRMSYILKTLGEGQLQPINPSTGKIFQNNTFTFSIETQSIQPGENIYALAA